MDEFQSRLGALVEEVKPLIVVETGHQFGESSRAVVAALEKNGAGKIYSIEAFSNPTIKDGPHFQFVHGYSYDQMEPLFLKTGPWDLFLHDSDHDVACMTFELELAWSYVRQGGIVSADDYTWGTPPHDAWQKFIERHEATPIQLGSVQYCIRTCEVDPIPSEEWAHEMWLDAAALSNEAAKEYGHKPIFKL